MRDKVKQDITSCLLNEVGDSGLTPEDIALKISNKDIQLVGELVQELFDAGELIESSHSINPYKKYKIQKPGQEQLGR